MEQIQCWLCSLQILDCCAVLCCAVRRNSRMCHAVQCMQCEPVLSCAMLCCLNYAESASQCTLRTSCTTRKKTWQIFRGKCKKQQQRRGCSMHGHPYQAREAHKLAVGSTFACTHTHLSCSGFNGVTLPCTPAWHVTSSVCDSPPLSLAYMQDEK